MSTPRRCAGQGWWWEARGLLSDGGATNERCTWAVCAGGVLRNLALTRANQALMADPACLALLVRARCCPRVECS